MTPEQILKIIEESFNENISSLASETALGLDSGIVEKSDFMKQVKEKLDRLELINKITA